MSFVLRTGLILCVIAIWLFSFLMEDGDANTIGMYFLVFLFPCISLTALNTLIIGFATYKMKAMKIKKLIAIIPILVSGLFALTSGIPIPFIDGSLSFVGIVGLVSIGIPNIIWIKRLKDN